MVNLLTGRRAELAPALGAHRDLNAIVDAAGDAELGAELDRLAAETVKRARHGAPATTYEAATDDALARLEAVIELRRPGTPSGPDATYGRGAASMSVSASARARRAGPPAPRAWAEA